MAARTSAERPKDPFERLNLGADAMRARGAALTKVADAAGTLYRGLDDAQKHRFMVLARVLRPHGGADGFARRGFDGPGRAWRTGRGRLASAVRAEWWFARTRRSDGSAGRRPRAALIGFAAWARVCVRWPVACICLTARIPPP
jgi:hypothetical protein